MKILLAGDSKWSWNLIRPLLDRQNQLTVVHTDRAYCQQLADQYEDIVILNGDSTDLATLEDAFTADFDMAIALSLYDSENLIICELCQTVFRLKRTAAVINCPRNADVFRKLGVATVIDVDTFILSCIQ